MYHRVRFRSSCRRRVTDDEELLLESLDERGRDGQRNGRGEIGGRGRVLGCGGSKGRNRLRRKVDARSRSRRSTRASRALNYSGPFRLLLWERTIVLLNLRRLPGAHVRCWIDRMPRMFPLRNADLPTSASRSRSRSTNTRLALDSFDLKEPALELDVGRLADSGVVRDAKREFVRVGYEGELGAECSEGREFLVDLGEPARETLETGVEVRY